MNDNKQIKVNDELRVQAKSFLERDFNQCFAQMRHYDKQIVDICKFSLGAYPGLIGVIITLLKVSEEYNLQLQGVAAVIAAVTFAFGLILLVITVLNRVYFVHVTRYINQHRKFYLESKPLGFEDTTNMYKDPTTPDYFNWHGSQTFVICVMALANAALFGVVLFVCLGGGSIDALVWLGAAVVFVLQMIAALVFLSTRETR